MSIENKHPDYAKYIQDWELIEDVFEGEKAVKAAGVKYLPSLSGQLVEEYESFKQRGSLFNALFRTVQGLGGMVFRKPVDYSLPPKVIELLHSIMSTGQSFEVLCRIVCNSLLKFGRVGLLVDSLEDSDPYVAVYGPKAIVNWRVSFVDGREQITLLVLKENYYSPENSDPFTVKMEEQYRSIELIDGMVETNIWRKVKGNTKDEWVIVETIYPKIKNKRQSKIMFYPIGSEENSMAVNKPPLIDMAYVNIDHWRLSVDYRHGLHFCSLPTPWAVGFDSERKLTIGPVRVWRSDDTEAKCGFLEFSGQGLASVRQALKDDEEQMAILGARIIEQTRSRIETAEAARIRQSGESGVLIAIVNNISEGLNCCFEGIAEWLGVDFTDSYIKLNTDFIDTNITPQELTSLLQTYQAGAMSLDTFLYNLEKGEILPPDQSIEDEKIQLMADENRLFESEEEDGDVE